MPNTNRILTTIHNRLVKPEMAKRKMDAEGIITHVYYGRQLVDVCWKDPVTGRWETAAKLTLPVETNGFVAQAPKLRDHVRVSFKSGDRSSPFVSMLYKRGASQEDYQSPKGARVPKGLSRL